MLDTCIRIHKKFLLELSGELTSNINEIIETAKLQLSRSNTYKDYHVKKWQKHSRKLVIWWVILT